MRSTKYAYYLTVRYVDIGSSSSEDVTFCIERGEGGLDEETLINSITDVELADYFSDFEHPTSTMSQLVKAVSWTLKYDRNDCEITDVEEVI
tara:strand:- start:1259 stop:1534 length:276 start_codon:yes stop_codon:yes gene_type:complete